MVRRPLVALLAVVGVALALIVLFLVAPRSSGLATLVRQLAPHAQDLSGFANSVGGQNLTDLPTRVATPIPTVVPTPTRVMREWEWVKPGFSGGNVITLTQGIGQFVYFTWSPACDAPQRHHIPMIWGKQNFYTDTVALENLFNGLCNDGRPLFFLNEPAKIEQANISPLQAAQMFYTMTRGTEWPYERWHGPIYAGNNVAEERRWDAEFVQEFAKLNGGSTFIPEIAGWGVHLYGNYEYGEKKGDPNVVWTGDVPPGEVRPVVYRSMRQVDAYLTERRAEGNATTLAVTEFGLLQASQWHTPRAYYYDTTARFMEEYVRQFDRLPEVQGWFWFISRAGKDDFLDTNAAVDWTGALTPNGIKWRELAQSRQ